ncbi:rCG27470 [Rattus norvegicus]|uniref:RCG27470 n=1 Tax=Rattus norvegicus TaxID=10116 RepID=A6KQN9_RAT|nr:rCG27470 [Rattus norvegicus]
MCPFISISYLSWKPLQIVVGHRVDIGN